MKKFLSIILMMALVLSMSIPVFANEGTGSITITNATIGEAYTVYKVFDASLTGSEAAKGVAYSIETDSQFFKLLFGADGKANNKFFVYNSNTGDVTKKEGVNDSELVEYLTKLIADNDGLKPEKNSVVAVKDAATDKLSDYMDAEKQQELGLTDSPKNYELQNAPSISFTGIPYGYYLITSSLGTTVTINSNTPDIQVIDKNQEPGTNFDKQVQIGVDENGDPIWGDANSAGIGEEITYKISFDATNYEGDKKIKYYQIHDEKGDAIWAEFNSFNVSVGGKALKKGYYLSQGGVNTDNWEFLGDWSDIDEDERDRNDADWYLVHIGYDKFRITIPWLENHSVENVTDDKGNVTSYALKFADGANSKFDSPSKVEITYRAVIEANAVIGDSTHGNRFNKASASWTSEHETGSTPPDEVVTNVYGIGLLKDDSATGQNLAGAKFRIYYDKECTKPFYVIPTNIDGVYIADSLGSDAENISGIRQETTRKLYEAYLADYLKDDEGNTITQNNLVVSQINGKLIILGLKAGTYYLKEVEAPSGYNGLSLPVEIKAGEGIRPFYIYADDNGRVADIQEEDGIHKEKKYDLTHSVVHNSKGEILPSTGGMGTFWLITIGTLLAIGFAIFLITHKKMSVYTD